MKTKCLLTCLLLLTLLAACSEWEAFATPEAALKTLSSSPISYTVSDGENSKYAERLADAKAEPDDAHAWQHATNRWSSDPDKWPLEAVLDFGSVVDFSEIKVHVGQTPSADRFLDIYVDDDNAACLVSLSRQSAPRSMTVT